MNSAKTPIPTVDSDELKTALLAAFGDDALNLIDDDEEDQFLSDLTFSENDSPNIRWAKEFTRSIYADRRASLANLSSATDGPVPISTGNPDRNSRCVQFVVGDLQFAVGLEEVREIARCPVVTRLPRTPNWLRGVANMHGQVISVTNLRNLLQIQSVRPTVGEKVIVLHSRQFSASTAIVVDRIVGIRDFERPPGSSLRMDHHGSTIANGVATIEGTETVLISADKLINVLGTER